MQLMPLFDVMAQADAGELLGSDPQSSQSAKGLFASILDRQSELARQAEQAARSAASRFHRREEASASNGQEAPSRRLAEAVNRLSGQEEDAGSKHDIKVTAEDFATIKQALKDFGFSDEDIEALGEKMASEGGLTWGKLVTLVSAKAAELSKTATTRELTPGEDGKLLSMFQKMGFTPQDAESLLAQFKDGNTDLAWARLKEKLADLPDDAVLDMDSADVDALAALLGLEGEAAASLKSLLDGADAIQLDKAGLKALLAAAQQGAANEADERLRNVVALRDAIKSVFDKASQDVAAEDRSNNGPDDTARRNMILAEHNRRQEKAEKDAPRPGENAALAEEAEDKGSEAAKVLRNEPSKSAAAAAKAADKAGSVDGKDVEQAADAKGEAANKTAGHGVRGDAAKTGTEALAEARSAAAERVSSEAGTQAEAKTGSQTSDSGDAADEASDPDRKAWDKLWSKVRREDADAGSTQGAAESRASAAQARAEAAVAFTNAASGADASGAVGDVVVDRITEGNAERVLRQVESGVLKNVGQGGKQLTLRLTPPDLGRVHLQIQVREGEVRVMLRAENSDAGKMISENLHHMRQSLEAQGLKVDKLEVQTQLAGDQSRDADWQGTQEHNELYQRHREMSRLSRLRSLRTGGVALAREMQNVHEQARISAQGIDLIA